MKAILGCDTLNPLEGVQGPMVWIDLMLVS